MNQRRKTYSVLFLIHTSFRQGRGLPIPLFAADGYAEDGEFDDEELLEEEPDGNMDPDDLPEGINPDDLPEGILP